MISKNEHYRCPRCELINTELIWRYVIKDLPEVLLVQPNRFQSGKEVMRKKNTPISYMEDEVIDLTRHLDTYRMTEIAEIGFHLHGVILDRSSCNTVGNGHYIAIVRDTRGKWLEYDDNSVSQVDINVWGRHEVADRKGFTVSLFVFVPGPFKLRAAESEQRPEVANGEMGQKESRPVAPSSINTEDVDNLIPFRAVGFNGLCQIDGKLSTQKIFSELVLPMDLTNGTGELEISMWGEANGQHYKLIASGGLVASTSPVEEKVSNSAAVNMRQVYERGQNWFSHYRNADEDLCHGGIDHLRQALDSAQKDLKRAELELQRNYDAAVELDHAHRRWADRAKMEIRRLKRRTKPSKGRSVSGDHSCLELQGVRAELRAVKISSIAKQSELEDQITDLKAGVAAAERRAEFNAANADHQQEQACLREQVEALRDRGRALFNLCGNNFVASVEGKLRYKKQGQELAQVRSDIEKLLAYFQLQARTLREQETFIYETLKKNAVVDTKASREQMLQDENDSLRAELRFMSMELGAMRKNLETIQRPPHTGPAEKPCTLRDVNGMALPASLFDLDFAKYKQRHKDVFTGEHTDLKYGKDREEHEAEMKRLTDRFIKGWYARTGEWKGQPGEAPSRERVIMGQIAKAIKASGAEGPLVETTVEEIVGSTGKRGKNRRRASKE